MINIPGLASPAPNHKKNLGILTKDKRSGVCSLGRFAVCTGVHTSKSHRSEERGGAGLVVSPLGWKIVAPKFQL